MAAINDEEQIVRKSVKNIKKRSLVFYIFVLATYAIVAYVFWSLGHKTAGVRNLELATELQAKEAQSVLKKVALLMVLPKDENPKVVIINNAAEIAKQQPFFEGTVNGDIFIGFLEAKKAIIYRPSKNLILNFGPIYGDTEQGGQATSNEASQVQAKQDVVEKTASSTATSSASSTKEVKKQ